MSNLLLFHKHVCVSEMFDNIEEYSSISHSKCDILTNKNLPQNFSIHLAGS